MSEPSRIRPTLPYDTEAKGQPRGGSIRQAARSYYAMDTIQIEVHASEDIKSTFADESSDQTTTSTHIVRGSVPQVEHVHSIDPATLLWLLLVYVVVRVGSPLIRDRAEHRRNGNGSGQGHSKDADTVLVKETPFPKRKPKPKPKTKPKPKPKPKRSK